MSDTLLVVDPAVYSLAGASLNSYACEFQRILTSQMSALADTGSMGGNIGESKDWATSYDDTVNRTLLATGNLIQAMGNYANILQEIGYIYAVSDWESGSNRPAPVEPSRFPATWQGCTIPPPSAGGPSNGLFDDIGFALSALNDYGVPIPDGEPAKLQIAADVWRFLASDRGVGNLPSLLDSLASSFESETAPALEYVDDDIRKMKAAATAVLDLYKDLETACREQKSALDQLRRDLETKARQLADDLAVLIAQEVVEGIITGVVVGALTLGFGATLVTAARVGKTMAKIALKVKEHAGDVRRIIDACKFKKKVTVKNSPEAHEAEMDRITDLTPDAKDSPDGTGKPKGAPENAPPIHDGKQGKHIEGHPNYLPGRSKLTEDPNELAKSAGTGDPVGPVPRGDAGFKERVDFGREIGQYADPQTGQLTPTSKGMIIYAKDGSIHIVPTRP
ncbi:polymorphic toxin type 50 domain-containing protein [Nocardia asteroides]|uniref:polymorphic toxin type 50 domain-containing protein n=1 Tax=Nocardia asteroides TaxID=1824 RepID=UPI0034270B7D